MDKIDTDDDKSLERILKIKSDLNILVFRPRSYWVEGVDNS